MTKKGIERSLNSVLKTIAKLSTIQKKAKSKTTKSFLIRKGKIRLYKEIAKELKKGLKGKPINKEFIDIAKSMIKEITPKRKVSFEKFFDDTYLYDKYFSLFHPHRKDFLSKGIKGAFKIIGFDMRDVYMSQDLHKIDEILGIEGLNWDETVSIIATYLHYPIEELFYKEPILEKGSGRIDKNYFLGKLTELIDEIRYIKKYQKKMFKSMYEGSKK